MKLGNSYTASVASNHPVIDDDWRTGFVIGILFLELNGYRFGTNEATAAQAVIEAVRSGTE